MNTIIRVVYEGETFDLDLDGSVPLRLDISTVEAGSIGSSFGVGSQTFDLSGTKNNSRFFKHAYNVSAEDIPAFYNTIPGYIIQNGETILQGQFQLLDIVTDTTGLVIYKCQISDQVVTFNSNIANKLIKDANWSEYNHDFTLSNIQNSWDNSLLDGKVYYPFVEYGVDNPDNIQLPKFGFLPPGQSSGYWLNNTLTPMQLIQFLPAIKAYDVLEVIAAQAGYNLVGDFLESTDFNSIYILPKGQEKMGPVGDESETSTFFAYLTTTQTLTKGANMDTIIWGGETSDPGNNYNPSTGLYVIPEIGDYTFSTNFSFFNPLWASAAGTTADVTARIMVGSNPFSGTVIKEETIEISQADGFITYTMDFGGSKYISTIGNDVWVEAKWAITNGSTSATTISLFAGNFQATEAPFALTGQNIDFSLQWPSDIKSIDLFKGILAQFNLVAIPEYGLERTLRIETFDHWMLNGRKVDWTEKFETAKRVGITHTVDEVQRDLQFSFSEDSDRFSKETIDNQPGFQYGTLQVLADNNISQGEKKVGEFFGPVILASSFEYYSGTDTNFSIDLSSRFVTPHLYKLENNNLKAFQFKPRIGYKVSNTFGTNQLAYVSDGTSTITVSGSYTTLANVSNLPVTASATNDTHFNNTYGTFGGAGLELNDGINSYNKYWKTYIESIYWEGSRKVTLDLLFDNYEYKDIRLNDKIFIKDQYYRINKIKGFNITNDDIVTVELLRLYPAYFQQGEQTCEFTISGSYSSDNCAAPTPIPIPTPVAPVPVPQPVPVAPVPIPNPVPSPVPTPIPVAPVPQPVPVPVSPTPSPIPTPVAPVPVPVAPTPVPVPQPVPVPVVSYQYSASSAFIVKDESCLDTSAAYSFYSDQSNPKDLIVGENIYSDANLTQLASLGGNDLWYGVYESGSTYPVWSIYLSSQGTIGDTHDCTPPVTPVPVSSGGFFRTALGYQQSGEGPEFGACDVTGSDVIYITNPNTGLPREYVNYVQENDHLWEDAAFTIPFTGSGAFYGLSDVNGGFSYWAIRWSPGGGTVPNPAYTYILDQQTCQTPLPPAPPVPVPVTPTPNPPNPNAVEYRVSSAFLVNSEVCGDDSSAYTIYSLETDPKQLTIGSILYADAGLNQPASLGGQDLWYGIYASGSTGGYPVWSVYYSGNEVADTFDCTPPAPPVPSTEGLFYMTSTGTSQTGTGPEFGACDMPATRSIYVTDSQTGLPVGSMDYIVTQSGNLNFYLWENSDFTGPLRRLPEDTGGDFYGITDTYGGLPYQHDRFFWQIGDTGSFTATTWQYSCGRIPSQVPSPVPVPVANPPQYWGTHGGFDITDCGVGSQHTDNQAYYISGSTLDVGTVLYIDPELQHTPRQFYLTQAIGLTVSGKNTPIEYIVKFNNSGSITEINDCTNFGLTEYSRTNANNQGTTCQESTTTSVWINSPNIQYIIDNPSGIRFYSANDTGSVFDGGSFFYGIASGSAPSPSQIQVSIYQGGINAGPDECSVTPTPVAPSPTPSPVPNTELFATSGSATDNVCASTDTNLALYIAGNDSLPTDGVVYYTDSNLTTPLSGNSQYYGITTGSLGTPAIYSTIIDNEGSGSTTVACPFVPTPVPITVYNLLRTTGQTIQGVVCGATANISGLYSTDSEGSDIEVGDILYSDSGLTTPFNGGAGLGQYYGVGTEIITTPQVEVRINSVGQVTAKTNCPPPPAPSPSPVPVTPQPVQMGISAQGRASTQDACADTSRNTTVYSLGKTSSQMGIGDTFYTDFQLTTPFNGGGQYWSWEDRNPSGNPRAGYINSSGQISFFNPVNCPS